MYQTLLFLHSATRWLVLGSLLYAIYRAYRGYASGSHFSKGDDKARHWTATIAHIQLILGILVYTQSPVIKYFWRNTSVAMQDKDNLFFGLIHISIMLIAIVVLTIGSALTKRRATDKEKFRTMLFWFSISLLLIFISIPWPFSPLANRPLLRHY